MDDSPDSQRAARPAKNGLLWVIAVYVLSVLVYVLLGRQQALPIVTPDEFTYGHLARSLADGDGFTWRGQSVSLHSALYIFVIAPTWLFRNTLTAYALSKVLGALMLSALVIPVWLLARQLLRPQLALLVAGFTVAGSWMTASALLLTENLAFPLATGAFAATVATMRQPGSRWGALALALALLAAGARFQLVLLVPVIAAALLLDAARLPSAAERRERIVAHRRHLLGAVAIMSIGLVVGLADLQLLAGTYSGVSDFAPSLGDVLSAWGKSGVALFAMAGFVPLVIAVSLAGTRRAWRDDDAGPLLAVLLPALIAFIAVSGWATAGYRVPWPIQRYVEYVLPLMFILLGVVAQRPVLLPRWAWLVAAGLGVLTFLGPDAEPLEGRAYYAVATGMHQLLGTASGVGVGVVALLVGFGGVALLLGVPKVKQRPAAWAVVALGVLVVALQAQAGWRWQLDRADEWRSGFPADLRAVDHATGGTAARGFLTRSHPRFETVDFFNRNITQEFAPPGKLEYGRTLRGRRCNWSVDGTGAVQYADGCGTPPSRLYLDDPAAIVTYADQHDVRRLHGLGRVVTVPAPPAATRVRSIAVMPCDDPTLVLKTGRVLGFAPRTCRAAFTALLWPAAPGTLVVRIRGGAADHVAQVGKQVFRLPARRVTTIRVQVPKGQSRLDLRFDTQELPAGLPDVASAVLVGDGRRQSIL